MIYTEDDIILTEEEKKVILNALQYQINYWKKQYLINDNVLGRESRQILSKSKIGEYNSIYKRLSANWGLKSALNEI